MPVSTITIAIFSAICLAVGVLYFAQMRERARIERVRKISNLAERYRRLQSLLSDLPPQYLSNDLRVMVAERSVETLKELIPLKRDAQLAEQLKADQEQLTQLRNSNTKFPPKPIRDENEAKEVRKLLQTLYKFVQGQHKRRLLDATTAKKHLEQITFFACQSRADVLVARAEAANKGGKPRVAIHNYHTAIAAYKPVMNHPAAVNVIAGYKQRITALDQIADAQNKRVKEQAQAKLEANKEWDTFLKDDDTWKKKNQYDD